MKNMTQEEKECLKDVIPNSAVSDLELFLEYDEENSVLNTTDYVYVMCRLAGYFDNLQGKLWSNNSLNENEQKVSDHLNSVLEKLPSFDGDKLYRIYANSGDLKETQLSFFKNNIGNSFELNAFFGTSSKPWEDEEDFIWEILPSTSTKSNNRSLRFEDIGLNPKLDSEEEVIFLPPTRFKIINVKNNTVQLAETNDEANCSLPCS